VLACVCFLASVGGLQHELSYKVVGPPNIALMAANALSHARLLNTN